MGINGATGAAPERSGKKPNEGRNRVFSHKGSVYWRVLIEAQNLNNPRALNG